MLLVLTHVFLIAAPLVGDGFPACRSLRLRSTLFVAYFESSQVSTVAQSNTFL